jgi:hypothetical protein
VTSDHWLFLPFDQFPPEQQPDGSWVYEANGRPLPGTESFFGGRAPDVVDFFPPSHSDSGYGVPIEPVGLPPIVNDSFGA